LGWTLHGHLFPALLLKKNELGAAISRLLPSFKQRQRDYCPRINYPES
jgi:hypothetical protein